MASERKTIARRIAPDEFRDADDAALFWRVAQILFAILGSVFLVLSGWNLSKSFDIRVSSPELFHSFINPSLIVFLTIGVVAFGFLIWATVRHSFYFKKIEAYWSQSTY